MIFIFVLMTPQNEVLVNAKEPNVTKWVEYLFLIWLITLPFGAKLFGFSIGSITLYPKLILNFLLIPFAISTFKKWSKLEISTLSFLFIWLVFSLFLAAKLNFPQEAIFDIRSLIMQFIFATTLIGMYHFIEKQRFKNYLIIGFRSFLFVLLTSGILDFLTGIHFSGTKTYQLLELPVGNVFYAPMFIYDNQNDYLSYLIFIFLLVNLFDKKLKNNFLIQLVISLIIYVFATFADSNFAKILSFGMILLQLGILIFMQIQNKKIKVFYPYFIAFLLLLTTILTNSLFFGPKYGNSANYRLNGVQVVRNENGKTEVIAAKEILSIAEQNQVIKYLDSVNTKSPENSVNLRKNLILNGIDFIKSAPIFGLGSGGFTLKTKRNEHKHFIHTHTSPHNFPIEIVSQFGIFGWFYFGLITFILFQFYKLRNTISTSLKIALITLIISLPFLWMMPSAYLYLNIHRLFLPLLLIQLLLIEEKSILNERK